jgi:hypothetical protein
MCHRSSFYAKQIRREHKLNLLTIPAHGTCNRSYQKDEDYFIHSLGQLCHESYSGNAIFDDLINQFTRPEGKRLGEMVFREFEARPSGLILPSGKLVKRYNGPRIRRVLKDSERSFLSRDKPFASEGYAQQDPDFVAR